MQLRRLYNDRITYNTADNPHHISQPLLRQDRVTLNRYCTVLHCVCGKTQTVYFTLSSDGHSATNKVVDATKFRKAEALCMEDKRRVLLWRVIPSLERIYALLV